MATNKAAQARLRELPSVDEILRHDAARQMIDRYGPEAVTRAARDSIGEIRGRLLDGSGSAEDGQTDLAQLVLDNLIARLSSRERAAVRRVINATGVVIHTNLGRAPLSQAAIDAIVDAAGYATVEYDLETGARGRRGRYAEQLITDLTGAEAVLIVNNCAAAAFMVLSVFAAGGEVIISRGELVEIGGDFRIPDVLTQSGATLVEVGTTNRTKLKDFTAAITERTKLILRVHPSNFRIVGFAAMPGIDELAGLARSNDILLYEDIGSGALTDPKRIGLTGEPLASRSLADGADIVTFSCDKLMGGPQAGVIAGRSELIERLRSHPLYRAMRVDKLTYAALGSTLEAYHRGTAADENPVLQMLAMTPAELKARAEGFAERLRGSIGRDTRVEVGLTDGTSAIGGGAGPDVHPATTLVTLTCKDMSADDLARGLRSSAPPVIARIDDGRVVVDMRTVPVTDEQTLIDAISRCVSQIRP